MKRSFIPLLFLFILSNCSKDCESNIQACKQGPDDAGVCAAYFESWVYQDGTCTFVGYSGCSAIGFESKVACEECDCD